LLDDTADWQAAESIEVSLRARGVGVWEVRGA